MLVLLKKSKQPIVFVVAYLIDFMVVLLVFVGSKYSTSCY